MIGERGDVTGVIMAGGQGARLGFAKARLYWDGELLLRRLARELLKVFPALVVTLPPREVLDWEPTDVPGVLIRDTRAYEGPLVALVQVLQGLRSRVAFVCSCDLPFMTGETALRIVHALGRHEAAIPKVEGRLQPLAAAYRVSAWPRMAAAAAEGVRRISELAHRLDSCILDLDEPSGLDLPKAVFFNINTPTDYLDALKAIGRVN